MGTIQANDDPNAGLVEKDKVAQLKQVATRNIRMTGNCDHFLRISIVPSTNKHRYITTSLRMSSLYYYRPADAGFYYFYRPADAEFNAISPNQQLSLDLSLRAPPIYCSPIFNDTLELLVCGAQKNKKISLF